MNVVTRRRLAAIPLARRLARGRPWRLAAWLIMAGLLAGCGVEMDALTPRGPAASRIATLWWFMLGTALAVYVIVIALLLYALMRGRRRRLRETPHRLDENRFVAIAGIVIPAIILVGTLVFTIMTGRAITTAGQPANLTVEVVGYQFWWEIRYPDQQFITANEIHVPVGQPVAFRLTSADVIHSFWTPELHGKLDLLPGTTNTFTIQADEPGVYTGVCAEFCGAQHAHMHFLVIAEPPDQFAAWLAQQRRPALPPAGEALLRGRQIFGEAGCAACHSISGAYAAAGDQVVAPDLTHLASRRTLAAGTLENTRGNLAAWIVDPQHFKPGNNMPPTALEADALIALVLYLESLE